jgi:hypothetical protein
VAALEAGLQHVSAPVAVVLSADLPFLRPGTVRALLDALEDGAGPEGLGAGGTEAVVLVDADGRDQPLVAAYRTEPLRRELALLAAEHGRLAHLPLRLLTAELTLHRLAGPDAAASFDCDTWEDVAAARAQIREHGNVLDEWMSAVKSELGIELDVDTGVLLDLARDAAHNVARPAAPLTTFLVGYVAGRAGGSPEEVAVAARKAAALALGWAEESARETAGDASQGPGENPEAGQQHGQGTTAG